MGAAGELLNISGILEINSQSIKSVLWVYNRVFDTVPSSNSPLSLYNAQQRLLLLSMNFVVINELLIW